MKMILIAVGALVVGIALGIVFSAATIRHLRSRIKGCFVFDRFMQPQPEVGRIAPSASMP